MLSNINPLGISDQLLAEETIGRRDLLGGVCYLICHTQAHDKLTTKGHKSRKRIIMCIVWNSI